MLLTFHTPAYADITMFGDVAQTLIERMGHMPTVPGAIAAEDVPEALERLRRSIEEDHLRSVPEPRPDAEDDEGRVSLANRALPLIQLLQAAADAQAYVMWDR
ncbi:protein of unknown function DUF1840 [Thioalkalivibrio nitratireducens DSM 14787]|uniref:DUF1840 domain-containing protein n=1 Tax=Thioalkalivibrio nitratireducens (strain DSM 14787 / UNIQEM 213 / ALEN2) TaxID=1255043 RepID=L0DXK0_THIND|nr:DUF1840 domain-containing protein [Thioalkalivibrio nitratireducens]AGA33732.1 protein of unknown function DUF1840 [Thioalkalivibrio nitratireducens DSM 14787]